jgi:hypothetical protein
LPLGKHALLSKGVLDLKKDAKVNIERYKYRLVALGYRQVDRRDYQEVFAPTALSATLKILLAVAAADGLELRQADVKTAFLNGNLEEEVYLKPPPEAGNGEKVWRLSKALYGLKQAARAWQKKLAEAMLAEGFEQSENDPCLFIRGEGEDRTYMLVHVDDVAVAAKPSPGQRAINDLGKQFDVKDMALMSFFLRQEVKQVPSEGIYLSQAQFA